MKRVLSYICSLFDLYMNNVFKPNWPAPRKGSGTNEEKELSLPSRKSSEESFKKEAPVVSFPTGHPFWIQDGIGDHSQDFVATRA